jgi:predicted ATPase
MERGGDALLTRLRLEHFKGFREADVPLGPFTVIVGANATGKSNLRDAFRFLHAIGRRYTLAECLGEKWGEGGVLQWSGIRGGTREVAFRGESRFTVSVTHRRDAAELGYSLTVDLGEGRAPTVHAEALRRGTADRGWLVYRRRPPSVTEDQEADGHHILVGVTSDGWEPGWLWRFLPDRPVLVQLHEHPKGRKLGMADQADLLLAGLARMRFLDLAPEAMRRPSPPGITVLGDRGEHLPSVLQAICQDQEAERALLDWVGELTPMDAAALRFPPYPDGRVGLSLIEEDGTETSAYSASDGTLRFLAMAAALVGSQPGGFYFLEELDNGIHPSRLSLLLELIEQATRRGDTQVIATTHSPQLLAALPEHVLADALVTYRLPGEPSAEVRRILDLPDAARVVREHSPALLHETGWFENAAYLGGGDEEPLAPAVLPGEEGDQ